MRIWHEDLPHSVSFRWGPKPQRHLLAFSVVTDWFLTGNWRPHRNKMVRIFKNNKIVISKIAIGSPLIGRKNGSIFLTNRLMRTVNKMAVLWEELENLLNKPKPSYREIRPMRGRLMRGLPVYGPDMSQ